LVVASILDVSVDVVMLDFSGDTRGRRFRLLNMADDDDYIQRYETETTSIQ
jgi:hypothetical protein